MNPTIFFFLPLLLVPSSPTDPTDTLYNSSKALCLHCMSESKQFLYGHNLIRARKSEPPLTWDTKLESYAKWWGGLRQQNCELEHSFQDDEFTLWEKIFWGGGDQWSSMDVVEDWADEEKYYDCEENRCTDGLQCGHYTQIVWKSTRNIGCARVVCEDGDVFMTCNYYPSRNEGEERPY